MPSKQIFCFGMGFCARVLGNSLSNKGWIVSGTSRNGVGNTVIFDSRRPLPDPAGSLSNISHILLSIPPNEEGDPVFNCHASELARLSKLKWLGYLSTTSVYGDRKGGWVDETTPVAPTHRRGEYRVLAERNWLNWAKKNKVNLIVTTKPEEAVKNSDCVMTDKWVSMNDKVNKKAKKKILKPFQVNKKLMSKANSDAIFMHCLPVGRGEEVTDEVIDGKQSVVWRQALNRVHAQKSIIKWCLD